MNWFKQNTFLAGLIAVAIAGVLGFGFLANKNRIAYNDAYSQFQTKSSALVSLKRSQLYPSDENARQWKAVVDKYEDAAAKLRADVVDAQSPMPANVSDVRFLQDLKDKVTAVEERATQNNVELPTKFYMAMEDYETTTPRREACNLLTFQLDAIQFLVDTLFENDATSIEGLARKRLEIEDEPPPEDDRRRNNRKPVDPAADVHAAYPIELAFTAPHDGAREILNTISNNNRFYFVINFLRLENEKNDGPVRKLPGDEDEVEAAPESEEGEEGAEGAEGAIPKKKLEFLFGTENVRVYLNMDLVRLQQPGTGEVAAK